MENGNTVKMGNITQKWVEILMPFCNDYSVKLTASDISRSTKISQQTASRVLNKLVKFNLISYTKEGKNKMFFLDLKKQITRTIINIAENQKSLRFQLKARKVAIMINEFLDYCDGIIVFGSYSSGSSQSDSDLDIVIFGANKEKIKQIKKKYLIEVNEHYVEYREFEKILDGGNPLAIEILNSHILFGNISSIVKIFWRKKHGRR
ncbi:winged helix-turn-helix transcriptional regulator [Candidatus Pacearchaeota archaeon]|nr:winged helix-turn-helix transcriptional regulator [Candidatus Pacearchaeota archaeon]